MVLDRDSDRVRVYMRVVIDHPLGQEGMVRLCLGLGWR